MASDEPGPRAAALGPAAAAKGVVEKFEKGGDNDVTTGPMGAKKRGCTDFFCLIVFLGSWAAYVFVTMAGLADGEPAKLYKPRDYRGQFCGVEKNWGNDGNAGLNLLAQEKLTYMMNVAYTVEETAQVFMCSSATESELRRIWGTMGTSPNSTKLANYECACCKVPCGTCTGSLDQPDITSVAGISGVIGGRMGDLTNSGSGNIFSPGGANGDAFTNLFEQANKFFIPVCTTSCDAVAVDAARTYTYTPLPDAPLSEVWRTLTTDATIDQAIKTTISTAFNFKALPKSVCPYEDRYCVPFPGVTFQELPAGDMCMFKLTAQAMSIVGDAAGAAFEGLGADKIADTMLETWGSWTGDFVDTIDAFVVVSLCSFVIGLLFLVLLRYFVGCVVWLSILLVFMLFLFGGGMCYIRHTQCAGTSLFASGHQTVVSIALAGQNAATNIVTGGSAPSESMTGNGQDYRGAQTRTRTNKLCQAWASDSPHANSFKNVTYPDAGLDSNYCRNPAGSAGTIWCYTTDTSKKWELCNPIGLINSKCLEGYEVEAEEMRKALEIIAFVLWGFALLWMIAVCCMCKQIFLAIAVNKVAAIFVYNTPSVLFVPIAQTIYGILWCLIWCYSAAFLLSQVPADHVPSSYFATYDEAYGTTDVPGLCTGPWINGQVYHYAGDPQSASNPCSGAYGDTTGMTPKCWGCIPPRYVIDWRFAISFFHFLWNNAFTIAIGQLIIAVACCTWFFTPNDKKGSWIPGRGRGSVVRTGVWYCFRYHLGSLAMGSFIIAVVQFIRYTLMYLEKQATAGKNRVAAMVMRVVQCLLWCLEKCIKFLNKNAYIQIALLGKPFCTSAKNAFSLILRNMLRFGWVAALGGAINAIGIVFIVVASAVVGYFILKGLHPDVTPVLPMAVYCCLAYLVAQLYMNVFHLSVDSILQCFIATEEMGGDNPSASFVPSAMQGMVKEQDEKKGSS